MKTLVTKELLLRNLTEKPAYTIGRILVAIFNKQTSEEQSINGTRFFNNVGFCKPDARIGCIGAKTFLKTKTLPDWVVKIWLAHNKRGEPRIVKYCNQLNKIANEKLIGNANQPKRQTQLH